jgi:hypothetical protein
MCDHFVILGGIDGWLCCLALVLVFGISPILKWLGRKRWFGGDGAFVVGDEVAEADNARLGHYCGVLK